MPVILLPASLENANSQPPLRANRVELIGCDDRFWQLGSGRPRQLPEARQIVLNRPLAEQLGVAVGDTVLVRLPQPGAIPADSSLGRKRDTVRTQRLTVSEIIPAEGLGRFGLRPTQRLPQNAYVPLGWLQDRLEKPGRANAILAAEPGSASDNDRAWHPQLTDYGLTVARSPLGYWNITSDRMLLEPEAERAIADALSVDHSQITFQPALTYLANTIGDGRREIPYSTITAIDFAAEPPLGPFLSPEGKSVPPLGADEIALNSWAAENLGAKIGDTIAVTFFEPESVEGQVREKTVSLRLAAVVRRAGAADDRGLTPIVKGMTDELSMADWDPPFPFDAKRIRPADEQYWDHYGPTPKAFVALATGRRLWGSRFGQTTSIRVAAASAEGSGVRGQGSDSANRPSTLAPPPSPLSSLPSLLQQRLDPAKMGLVFQPVKRQGLAASAGTTPFGVLFLCFSFFIIAAAVILVAILFRLGIDRRATQIGTLLAVGLPGKQVGRLLLAEGLLVAAAGSLLGLPAGVAYAALMLLGLRTWWLAAVVTPFLRLYISAASLAIGGMSGLVVAYAAIWLSVRRIRRLPPRRLLAGETIASPFPTNLRSVPGERQGVRAVGLRAKLVEAALLLLAVAPAIGLLAGRFSEEVRAGMFFVAGAIALMSLLALVWLRLRSGRTGPAVALAAGTSPGWPCAMPPETRAAARSPSD